MHICIDAVNNKVDLIDCPFVSSSLVQVLLCFRLCSWSNKIVFLFPPLTAFIVFDITALLDELSLGPYPVPS